VFCFWICRIVKELRTHFSDLRILKGLLLKQQLAVGRDGNRAVGQAFELMFQLTQTRIACW